METENDIKLTAKEEKFCYEYAIDLNATQAAIRAGYSQKTARAIGYENLTKPHISTRIRAMQANLCETAGITALKVILEHKKIAFVNTSDIYKNWHTRREFEELPEEVKACISEIDTKIKTEWEYDQDQEKKVPVHVEYVRVKLFDKQKALDSISKLGGFNAPEKTEITGKGGRNLFVGKTDEELREILNDLRDE